jgi:hypothetical protein
VSPLATTTYTCIATGAAGGIDQQQLTVTVPAGGGGGGGQGPIIKIVGGNTINTGFRFVTLDASQTTSPSGNTPLTFTWVSLNDRAVINNANQAVTQVTLGVQPGSYLFQLTVTDSKGNQATAIVTVILTI